MYKHVNGSGVAQPAFDQAFGYDDLNRLVSWTLGTTSYGYAYDLTGNRTQFTVGANNCAYSVATTSNRLTSTAGPAPAQTNAYDAAGHLTGNGQVTLATSDRGRLSRVAVGASNVDYVYNALEQRVKKSGPTALVPGGASLYAYDEGGKLLGEYDADALMRQEVVYLGDTPVAMLTQTVTGTAPNHVYATAVQNVYADQIDTPRVVTRASDHAMRWRWDGADPFGTLQPDGNPASLGTYVQNLRFPGQYYDQESNLHYAQSRGGRGARARGRDKRAGRPCGGCGSTRRPIGRPRQGRRYAKAMKTSPTAPMSIPPASAGLSSTAFSGWSGS